MKYTKGLAKMNFSRNTLSQLKNGGNMRLIRNRNVVDSLDELDNLIDRAERQYGFLSDSYHPLASLEVGIFNDGFYRKNGRKMSAEFILTSPIQPVLLTKDYTALIEYANMFGKWSSYVEYYQKIIANIYEHSIRLKSFIKKQYHLE